MSERCFKISGNFQQDGQWSNPDPGFVGYIIVNDDGMFEGYMDEQYEASFSNRSRFVAGTYDEKSTKLAYYKLNSSLRHAPLLYVFPATSELGQWIIFDNGAYLGGKAKVELFSTAFDPELQQKIHEVKQKIVENGPIWNKDLVSRVSDLVEVFDVKF